MDVCIEFINPGLPNDQTLKPLEKAPPKGPKSPRLDKILDTGKAIHGEKEEGPRSTLKRPRQDSTSMQPEFLTEKHERDGKSSKIATSTSSSQDHTTSTQAVRHQVDPADDTGPFNPTSELATAVNSLSKINQDLQTADRELNTGIQKLKTDFIDASYMIPELLGVLKDAPEVESLMKPVYQGMLGLAQHLSQISKKMEEGVMEGGEGIEIIQNSEVKGPDSTKTE